MRITLNAKYGAMQIFARHQTTLYGTQVGTKKKEKKTRSSYLDDAILTLCGVEMKHAKASLEKPKKKWKRIVQDYECVFWGRERMIVRLIKRISKKRIAWWEWDAACEDWPYFYLIINWRISNCLRQERRKRQRRNWTQKWTNNSSVLSLTFVITYTMLMI